MPEARAWSGALLSWLVLSGCSGGVAASAPTADASTEAAAEAGADAEPQDAGAREGGDAGACELGAAPATLGAIASEVIADGTPPAATGGDPTGVWIHTKITVYLPASAATQVDPARSKVTGTGYSEFLAGRFRSLTDTETTLATAAFGDVVRASTARAKGTYVVQGSELVTKLECRDAVGDTQQGTGNVRFSRVSATAARFTLVTSTQLGTVTIVTDAEKAP